MDAKRGASGGARERSSRDSSRDDAGGAEAAPAVGAPGAGAAHADVLPLAAGRAPEPGPGPEPPRSWLPSMPAPGFTVAACLPRTNGTAEPAVQMRRRLSSMPISGFGSGPISPDRGGTPAPCASAGDTAAAARQWVQPPENAPSASRTPAAAAPKAAAAGIDETAAVASPAQSEFDQLNNIARSLRAAPGLEFAESLAALAGTSQASPRPSGLSFAGTGTNASTAPTIARAAAAASIEAKARARATAAAGVATSTAGTAATADHPTLAVAVATEHPAGAVAATSTPAADLFLRRVSVHVPGLGSNHLPEPGIVIGGGGELIDRGEHHTQADTDAGTALQLAQARGRRESTLSSLSGGDELDMRTHSYTEAVPPL